MSPTRPGTSSIRLAIHPRGAHRRPNSRRPEHSLPRLARVFAVPALCALALAVAACSGKSKPAATPTAGGASPATTAAATATAPSSAATATVPALTWHACGGGFECSSLPVPVDYANPSGGTIALPLIRLPASDQSQRIGSLITNPGGPGGSGVDFVRSGAKQFFPSDVRARFDIVGFDPRGVGASQPAVDCVDNLDAYVEEDPAPTTAEQPGETANAQTVARGCADRSGAILKYVTTANVARDMDVMRGALGDEKITYAGFSYGTLIGALYADMFPQHIRAMTLDGAVDPALSPVDDARAQILGFEQALDAFLNDCSSKSSCAFHSGGDAASAFDALMARIRTSPVPSDDGREVGPGLAWLGVAAALYDETSWPVLARGLQQARDNNDGTQLASMADAITGRNSDGTYDNSLEQRIAVDCVDFPHLTPDQTSALLADLATSAPRFGPNSGLASADPCDFWPVPPQRVPGPVSAAGAPPIVVVGTTGDPATPYQQSVSLAKQLKSGTLLTFNGQGHTAYGKGNSCVDDTIDRYLIDLTPPAPGATC